MLENLPSLTHSQLSTQTLPPPSPEQIQAARNAAERLLSSFPDYGRASAEYVRALIETLAWCSPSELAELLHPREGLATVCKFLPAAADIHGFLRDKRQREAKYNPHTAYHRLEPEAPPPGWETSAERRRRIVTEKLGYNPAWRVEKSAPRVLSRDGLPASLDLKTPPRPASDELKKYLLDTGYGHLITPHAGAA